LTHASACALPQACVLCHAESGAKLLCCACHADLPGLPPSCPQCALPSPGNALCGACLRRAPPFAAALAACRYAFPLDGLLHQFKYGRRLAYAPLFADLIVDRVRQAGNGLATVREIPDCLAAVPLAPARQRERGFNQAHEIARRVSRQMDLPLLRCLIRTRHAPPQALLDWSARRTNLANAFVARPTVAGRSVAIVDDVMTSGATMHAAAQALRGAGAVQVEVWVVARTLLPSSGRAPALAPCLQSS
jgi:ComF family protein